MKITTATLLATAAIFVCGASNAMADDYTDLLDILHARGSLSASEYKTLLTKHLHGGSTRATRRRGAATTTTQTTETTDAEAESRRDALAAAASAAAAQASMQKMEAMQQQVESDPSLAHVLPYKPGKGVDLQVGAVDFNISAIINGFYTYSSADNKAAGPGGGLSDNSGFDSSAIRNGLLPGALIVSAATKQEGYDISAVIGVYPGINSASVGALNANNGGNSTALGTPGADFRKVYFTVGTQTYGTIKIGRDIDIFGADAILNDATLLSVGATGGNADPANTALGRIGFGYIYTDFQPQISYISPIFAGFQATIGAFEPLNEFDFSGDDPYTKLPLSGTATAHNVPEFEGKVTYDKKTPNFSAHLWTGFMTQPEQGISTTSVEGVTAQGHSSKVAAAGEVGGTLTFGPAALTAYYYYGSGVGTTGKFFDGLSPEGRLRNSEGGYVQGSFNVLKKLKLVASYGESSLYQAPGEFDPDLVRRNEAEIGAAYYTLTDWVTLVGEFSHQVSKSHGPLETQSNAFTAGGILFY